MSNVSHCDVIFAAIFGLESDLFYKLKALVGYKLEHQLLNELRYDHLALNLIEI